MARYCYFLRDTLKLSIFVPKIYGRPVISFQGATNMSAKFDGAYTTEFWRYDDDKKVCDSNYISWIGVSLFYFVCCKCYPKCFLSLNKSFCLLQ